MKIPWKLFLNVIFNAGFFFMISALEANANRGIRLQLRASEQSAAPIVEEVQLYASSYALVIGIDNYTRGWPRLSNAIRDAELVADELREKGFEVTLKANLNSTHLKSTFEEFFVLKGEDPQTRLFVWFAGHGYTQNGEGYLIPADAPSPDAGARFLLKALSMRRFGEYVRLARAKHAFAVFDSCFSGTIFTTQRSKPPAAVTRATTLPVRQFLSSGDEDQQVSDDGRFRKLFIRALRGEERADANGDGYLTGSELGMFLTDRVTNLTENRQTPRSGKLRDEDYDRGDFVFLLSSSGAVVEKPEKTGTQAILSVESNVTGARVLVDGRDVGTTNLSDTEILPGEHRIRVEKEGYEPYSRKVRFAEGRAASLYVDLRRTGPSKGRLYVDTEPEGARVRVLNIEPKYSRGMELDPGRYHIEVSAEGYETERQWVDLAAGQEEPFSFDLAKIKVAEPTSPQKTITNSIGMKFMLIPAGSFTMGSQISPEEVYKRYGGDASWYKDEHPQHKVTISKAFYMQSNEVTQGQWKEIMGANPSDFKDCGENCPVENVSWDDAQRFIRRLNEKEGGKKYRLPTEAEWEYACRSGTTTVFSFGDDGEKLDGYGWYSRNSNGRTHPVATLKSNSWGLYDMHGNVWEWRQDWYGAYPSSSVVDPTGPSDGERRVLRGGSWGSDLPDARCADRAGSDPLYRYGSIGVRCVRTLK